MVLLMDCVQCRFCFVLGSSCVFISFHQRISENFTGLVSIIHLASDRRQLRHRSEVTCFKAVQI